MISIKGPLHQKDFIYEDRKKQHEENRDVCTDSLVSGEKGIGILSSDRLFVAAMLFLTVMMLHNLTNSAPWGDEWVEYSVSKDNISTGEMYQSIISTYQPPLYNFLMHFWLKIGDSVLWFRLFNVVCGIISGIFCYAAASRLTNQRIASFSLFILSAVYRWVYCIQECSEYALMLMFLFLALYFYTVECETDSVLSEILLILSCVGAIYSQYGAFFVIVPILIAHLIRKCMKKEWHHILRSIVFYLFSLIVFAVPLYVFYARIQLANHEIAENAIISIEISEIIDFLFVFGRLMAWLLNIGGPESIRSLVGVIVLLLAVIVLCRKGISYTKKSLIVTLLAAYVMYYWLVVFHIYGMIAANESRGFYTRYAYFFIPVLAVCLPVIVYELGSMIPVPAVRKGWMTIAACTAAAAVLIAMPSLLKNWKKAYDDEFAEIWVYNGGFDDTTYLFGAEVDAAFEYYTGLYTYEGKGEVVISDEVDMDNLPDSFWVWGSNWDSSESWNKMINAAYEQGFKVVIYANVEDMGELAYCCME